MERFLSDATGRPANDGTGEGLLARFDIAERGAGESLPCEDVIGFEAARACALDLAEELPSRLALVGARPATRAWLEDWAEDTRTVHRSIEIQRRLDGVSVRATVTLAAFGSGVETQLAVESIASEGAGALGRSGVHPRADGVALDPR